MGRKRQISGKAVASLTFGVLGFVGLGGLGFLPAFFLGKAARRDIASRGLRGEGIARWGYWLGIVGLSAFVLLCVIVVLGFLFQRLA